MESANCATRSTLQTLEKRHLALEISLLEYLKRKEIPYEKEVKTWLAFITRFSVEERTMMLHLFVSILINEPKKIAEDRFLEKLRQQLLEENVSEGLVTQLMKMYDTYRLEREEDNGTA